MSTETKTDRVLRDVLNSDNLRDLLGEDAVNNAMRWRFLQAALYVLDGHGLLGDPADAVKDGDDDGHEAAPLDPKSVHVGDTVTVRFKETGDEIVTKAYQPDDITAAGEYVYLLGWPLHRANGTFGLALSYFEILAIEAAPVPEPEWLEGDVADISVRGCHAAPLATMRAIRRAGGWRTSGGNWDDVNVEVITPLVVIDPAAVNLNNLFQAFVARYSAAMHSPFGATEDEARRAGIDGVLADLGIEATS